MDLRKYIEDGYILFVGIGCAGEEITAEEYVAIMDMIRNKPKAEAGFDYRLKTDLTWELFEVPTVEIEATEEDYLASLEKLGVRDD